MADDTNGEQASVEMLFDSTLESVDKAEAIVLEAAGKAGFAEEQRHEIGMAVRETMVNAVVHGNRYSAHKKVRLSVISAADRLTVAIVDQGEGFDLNAIPNPLASENLLRQSGRGILLIQAFVDEFEVRRGHPAGTEVRLTKFFSQR